MGNLDSGYFKNNGGNLTKSKLQQILDYCERSFVEQVGGGFDGQLEDVLISLKQLAENAKGYKEKQFYNEMYFSLINARSGMSVEFKTHLKKYFKEKIKKQMEKENTGEVFDSSMLRIVSEAQENMYVEEKKLEKSMEEKLGDELLPLNARIESLLGETGNPFTPDVVIKAFAATIEKVIKDELAQRHLFTTFGKICPEQLKTTYQVMNNFLVSNDIVPDVKEYVRKQQEIKRQQEKYSNKANTGNETSGYFDTPANPLVQDFPNLPALGGSAPLSSLNVPNVPIFGNNQKPVPNMNGGDLNVNPPTIPGFENINSSFEQEAQRVREAKINLPSKEDFKHMTNIEEEDLESFKIREEDSPAQKKAKWEMTKETISTRFNRMLGKVRDTTPIKEAVIGTDSPTIRPVPPGYTSVPAYQIKPNNFHKVMKEAVNAQRAAEARGEVFNAFPEGITQEQVEAHKELFLSKEDSTMLNDSETLRSFFGYQLQFKKARMTDVVRFGIDDENYDNKQRNVLAEIAEASVQNHKMDPNETMIVDLLSLVFEKIFSHPQLPVHIKFLVSKLQIPILRTSLLDKTFFIYRDNPVRLFLDCLATHETLYNLEFHEKFEVIIDDLLTSDEITQNHFSEALEKIQLMLRDYSAKENKLISQIATPISLEEKAAENYEAILEYLRDKITKRTTYVPFISFVENVWAKGFADRWTLDSGKDGAFLSNLEIPAKLCLNQGLLVFEMIIWSNEVRAKTFENREKLKSFVPKINDGLDKMKVDLRIAPEEVDKLKELLKEKQNKFISDVERTKEQEALLIEQEDSITKGFTEKAEPIRKIKAAKKDIASAKSDFDEVFTSGRWFEFVHDKSKLRLVWVSPQKTTYLFNNPEKKKVYKFDKSRVWAYYRSSHIKLISNEAFGTETLIEEAVTGNKVEKPTLFSI